MFDGPDFLCTHCAHGVCAQRISIRPSTRTFGSGSSQHFHISVISLCRIIHLDADKGSPIGNCSIQSMALVLASSLKLGSCICSRRTTNPIIVRSIAISSSSTSLSYSAIRTAPTSSFSFSGWFAGLPSKSFNFALSGALALGLSLAGVGFAEAKVGVNKPELLPKEFSVVIDIAGFLSDGQEKRLAQEIANLEKDTGFKLRVLAQNYPETPGLAVRDFWQVDDRTVVFVADPTFGNILNFNVGAFVDLEVPRSFWSRLAGKYGNMFYWKEKGEDASIEAAVMAISNCLREPAGPNNCSEIK